VAASDWRPSCRGATWPARRGTNTWRAKPWSMSPSRWPEATAQREKVVLMTVSPRPPQPELRPAPEPTGTPGEPIPPPGEPPLPRPGEPPPPRPGAFRRERKRRAVGAALHEKGGNAMSEDRHIDGEVNSKTSLGRVFKDIRRDVASAHSRPALTELYKRAGYLITLTHAPSWQEKFGPEARHLRETGEEEFARTARKINRRAAHI